MSPPDAPRGKVNCVVGDAFPLHKVNPIAVTIIVILHLALSRPELATWHGLLINLQHTAISVVGVQLVAIAVSHLRRGAIRMRSMAAVVGRASKKACIRIRRWFAERIQISWSFTFKTRTC